MAEPSEDPTNRQLLERIAQLEAQNAKLHALITRVHQNLDTRLKGDVVDLRLQIIRAENRIEAVKEELDISKMENKGEFRNIDGILGALITKVFPKFHELRDKVWAIVPPRVIDPLINKRLDERPPH